MSHYILTMKISLYENVITKMLATEQLFQTKENRVSPSMLYNAERRILDFFERRKNDLNRKIISNFDEYP